MSLLKKTDKDLKAFSKEFELIKTHVDEEINEDISIVLAEENVSVLGYEFNVDEQ